MGDEERCVGNHLYGVTIRCCLSISLAHFVVLSGSGLLSKGHLWLHGAAVFALHSWCHYDVTFLLGCAVCNIMDIRAVVGRKK